MPFIVRRTITETFLERVAATPDALGFQYKAGAWKQVSFREFHDDCRIVAQGLMGLGVKPGDRVAILSQTRYEWALTDMAILGARAITVPVYASITPEDVAYVLDHSESRVVVLEDRKQLEKVLARREELTHLEKIVVLDPLAMLIAQDRPDVLTFHALLELGKREQARDPGRFERNLREAEPDDLITICYTSGTTGTPKGAMLTHDNMISVLEDAVARLERYIEPEKEVLVAFLPFSHVLGKMESMATYAIGWRECYAESMDALPTNILEVRPTILIAVPRIFEKAHARIIAEAERGPPSRKKIFDWAVRVGRQYFREIYEGRKPSLALRAQVATARQLVFNKVLERFGGRLRFAVSGGAPLAPEIAEFFSIVGIQVLEGYGLTETSAPITVNTPDAFKLGTVGRPLPEVSLKIAEDGEILVKSRKVFKGYYKMPEETAAALEEGWLKTGDIGLIDADGFLHITDRKKDLIITSGGKNIAPQKIENLAKSQKYINQLVVQGDRRKYLTALVTLHQDLVVKYANENQILYSGYPELIKNPKIQSLIEHEIEAINSQLASYETIKRFVILPNEFTIESGELTPSLKVKRSVIAQHYARELDSLYEA